MKKIKFVKKNSRILILLFILFVSLIIFLGLVVVNGGNFDLGSKATIKLGDKNRDPKYNPPTGKTITDATESVQQPSTEVLKKYPVLEEKYNPNEPEEYWKANVNFGEQVSASPCDSNSDCSGNYHCASAGGSSRCIENGYNPSNFQKSSWTAQGTNTALLQNGCQYKANPTWCDAPWGLQTAGRLTREYANSFNPNNWGIK